MMLYNVRMGLLGLCVVPVILFPGVAQAGWLEFFFPSLRDQDLEPVRTLTAPFADTAPADLSTLPTASSLPVLPENKVPLDQPHRSTSDLAEWITMAVSEILTFKNADMQAIIDANKKYFDPNGQAQFQTFMTENNMTKVLETGRFNMHAFVKQTPLLLNEGNVDGRFRWLYEVPVMITYLDRSTKGYTKETRPVNQELVLTIQIGRTPDLAVGKDVVIERWTGKLRGTP